MSYTIEINLLCDIAGGPACEGAWWDVYPPGTGARTARRDAREYGWSFKDGKDICRYCNAKET
jgi:hypothetical protein